MSWVNKGFVGEGENPLMNLAVDARGMLRQGGGPTGIDWAMLGLSGLPIVSPYAKTAGTALKRSIQDWGKLVSSN